MGLIPGLGRSPAEGNGNHEIYHGNENSIVHIPWTEKPGGLHTVHKVAKSQTRISTHTPKNKYKNK